MLLLVIVSRSLGFFGSPIPVAGDCLVQLRWVGGLWDVRQFAEYSESGMHRPLKRPCIVSSAFCIDDNWDSLKPSILISSVVFDAAFDVVAAVGGR